MKRLTLSLLSLWLAFACGGESEDEGGLRGLSDAELEREIRAEAEALNSCETVDDCEAVTLGCGALYVNADAERERLDELLAEHQRRTGDVGCPAVCACGVLFCEAGRCVTESGDCMSAPPGGVNVCL